MRISPLRPVLFVSDLVFFHFRKKVRLARVLALAVFLCVVAPLGVGWTQQQKKGRPTTLR
jgi:uncharacterized membrane protein YqjE